MAELLQSQFDIQSIVDFFGYGTIEICQIFYACNELLADDQKFFCDPAITNSYCCPEINDVVKDILFFFGEAQVWYKMYVNTNSRSVPFFLINSTAHKKLCNKFYTPAVIVRQSFQMLHQDDSQQLDNVFQRTFVEIDDQFLQNLLIDEGGVSQRELNTANGLFFLNQVKTEGFRILTLSKESNLPIASLLSVNESALFASLSFTNKFKSFLKRNNASLNLLILYEQIQQNPLLYFDLKQRILQLPKNESLWRSLNKYIDTFWKSLSYQKNPRIVLTSAEMSLIQTQNAFFSVQNGHHTYQERVNFFNKIYEISENLLGSTKNAEVYNDRKKLFTSYIKYIVNNLNSNSAIVQLEIKNFYFELFEMYCARNKVLVQSNQRNLFFEQNLQHEAFEPIAQNNVQELFEHVWNFDKKKFTNVLHFVFFANIFPVDYDLKLYYSGFIYKEFFLDVVAVSKMQKYFNTSEWILPLFVTPPMLSSQNMGGQHLIYPKNEFQQELVLFFDSIVLIPMDIQKKTQFRQNTLDSEISETETEENFRFNTQRLEEWNYGTSGITIVAILELLKALFERICFCQSQAIIKDYRIQIQILFRNTIRIEANNPPDFQKYDFTHFSFPDNFPIMQACAIDSQYFTISLNFEIEENMLIAQYETYSPEAGDSSEELRANLLNDYDGCYTLIEKKLADSLYRKHVDKKRNLPKTSGKYVDEKTFVLTDGISFKITAADFPHILSIPNLEDQLEYEKMQRAIYNLSTSLLQKNLLSINNVLASYGFNHKFLFLNNSATAPIESIQQAKQVLTKKAVSEQNTVFFEKTNQFNTYPSYSSSVLDEFKSLFLTFVQQNENSKIFFVERTLFF